MTVSEAPVVQDAPTLAPNVLSGQDDELETYLLLLLSDSALPTGGFVASSGLESFFQHGFILAGSSSSSLSSSRSHRISLLAFISESLVSYARLNLPFFQRAHATVSSLRDQTAAVTASHSSQTDMDQFLEDAFSQLLDIDRQLEQMLLNHVARRASKAQGVALLTLYTRAFASSSTPSGRDGSATSTTIIMDSLIERLKAVARKPVTLQGHLPVCFAILTAALGLSLERSMHLHLFLQARAILSSAVRLNLLGPYAAQRVLLTDVRSVISEVLAATRRREYRPDTNGHNEGTRQADNRDDGDADGDGEEEEEEEGPATTWPLAEILGARHDQLHSRIFNS